MGQKVFELHNVDYIYPGGSQALNNLSLDIERGKRIAVLGPNGAGKSTMFLHLNGILRPKRGEIYFDGEKLKYTRKDLQRLREKVGIVFQDPDTQLFAGSVAQDISFGPINLGLSGDILRDRVDGALHSLGIEDLRDKPIHHLSYGQKKRVSIAGVLAMGPEVVIFDEPTAYLDPKHSTQLIETLDDLHASGCQVILSTHDVNLVYSWSDFVYVISGGELKGKGPPLEVFGDGQLLVKNHLQRPVLFDICESLKKKGVMRGENPRSLEDLKLRLTETEGLC